MAFTTTDANRRRDDVANVGVRGIGLRGVVVVIAALMLAPGCAGSKPPPAMTSSAPVAVPALANVAPVALQSIDAPGLDVEVLTARVREAFGRTSGAVVVDAASVRAEIAACAAPPCAHALQERFRAARYVASVTLSKVGGVVLGSARVVAGVDELARAHTRGPDVGAVVDELGWVLGARFRAVVVGLPAAEASGAPVAEER